MLKSEQKLPLSPPQYLKVKHVVKRIAKITCLGLRESAANSIEQ